MALAERRGVEVGEVGAAPQAILEADGVFLTNSLMGVRPVRALDGVRLAEDPLIEALSRAVRAAGLA